MAIRSVFPLFPRRALPVGVVPTKVEPVPVVSAARSQPSTAKTTENGKPAVSGLDAGLTQRIESFRQVVGDALYFEVFRRGGPARNARELPSVNAQHWVVKQLETLDRGIQRVRVLAEDVHENVFYGVLDAHKVQSIDKIPSFEVSKVVVTDLQNATQGIAA
jgi:hypothetical protein